MNRINGSTFVKWNASLYNASMCVPGQILKNDSRGRICWNQFLWVRNCGLSLKTHAQIFCCWARKILEMTKYNWEMLKVILSWKHHLQFLYVTKITETFRFVSSNISFLTQKNWIEPPIQWILNFGRLRKTTSKNPQLKIWKSWFL